MKCFSPPESEKMAEFLDRMDRDSWSRSPSAGYSEIEDEQPPLGVADRLAREFRSTYGPRDSSGQPYPSADSSLP